MWFGQKPAPATAFELRINFELDNPGDTRYRRPYVAIWVEDKKGFPIRTISLWAQTNPPGPRWIPELRRWFRSDRVRQFTDRTDMVATVGSPTRMPGKYTVTWDGKDDQKKSVRPGEYTVFLEVTREHGTYQLLRQPVQIADRPFQTNMGSNVEVKSATLEYRPNA